MSFIEELKWRGLLHNISEGTENYLSNNKSIGYVGFDPTASSLGIGNVVPIMLMAHFQRAGHQPIALVGGATAMIGDPSGKSEERKLLSMDQIVFNQEKIKKQLNKFLDFENKNNPALIVNNYDWFKEINFLSFLRDTGKHISINYMMAKDSVKLRLENGISFTEFSYQLIQAYDFYWLNKHYGCTIQMSGADQWGNITTGIELVRRMESKEVYAVTAPLITKADGTKFGKTENGNIWIDPALTSPFKFYQFWLNCSDEDAGKLIKIFTFLSKEEIESILSQHQQSPHLRLLQKTFAKAYKAGVKIAFGTDAGVYQHGKNWIEFTYMIEAGMTPMDAIKAATINAADLIGIKDQTGSIEVGKWADIVAVDGDPLTDAKVFGKVVFVMKDSVIYKQ